MAAQFAAAASFLGSPAGGQVMMATQHETQQAGHSNRNARLGWILAAIAILLYVGGLFIQRG
jgi:hypothetical protein